MARRKTREEIPWETFFEVFEKNELALLEQEKTADGRLSRFSNSFTGSPAKLGFHTAPPALANASSRPHLGGGRSTFLTRKKARRGGRRA